MRLSTIKLAGFKSFVDPTTLHLPTNMTGVVGPNGCGKSNIIDAVRWVMGESSASRLRGDNATDVIFSGSNARKPVSQATVELIFDNSDHAISGEFAAFNEISVKRTVGRDGQSIYYLNGGKCRRKDITDLFLGTGLGPRSYSIIEQGMISQVIEARPEELRIYLEEAAGISKYKERRRETENRIRHTRENLERLNDLRNEVGKQLTHLARQARQAEQYTALAAERRIKDAEWKALQYRSLDGELQKHRQALASDETTLERMIAEQRHAEREIETGRERHQDAVDAHAKAQAEVYRVGGSLARIEQQIQHQHEMSARLVSAREEAEAALSEIVAHIGNDEEALLMLQESLLEAEPRLEALRESDEARQAELHEAERRLSEWQQHWERQSREQAEAARAGDVERTRVDYLDRQLLDGERRRERLCEERAGLDIEALAEGFASLEVRHEEQKIAIETLQAEVEARKQAVTGLQEQQRELQNRLAEVRKRAQEGRGRLGSLETLQSAALGQEAGAAMAWLHRHGLQDAVRLGEAIQVESGWEMAVENALGQLIEGVLVENPAHLADALAELDEGRLALVAEAEAPLDDVASTSLAARITGPFAIIQMLRHWHVADDLAAAQALLERLPAGSLAVTAKGERLGAGWVQIEQQDAARKGALLREREIRTLREEIAALQVQEDDIEAEILRLRDEALAAEQAREEVQRSLHQNHRLLSELAGQLQSQHGRLESGRTRLASIEQELAQIERSQEEGRESVREARDRLEIAIERMAELEEARQTLEDERSRLISTRERAREMAREVRESAHALALQVETQRTRVNALTQALSRMSQQRGQLDSRLGELTAQLSEGDSPVKKLEAERQATLTERVQVDQALVQARALLEEIESRLREHEQIRQKRDAEALAQRERIGQRKLDQQAAMIAANRLAGEVGESGFVLAELVARLPGNANVGEWEKAVQDFDARLRRLEPVNLAAIAEHAEAEERKKYLDSQDQDLNAALETLEEAIRKIDRETRGRFKDTFDRVNAGVQALYPRLFGGGHAYLELTGDDLLSTGVSIMARPPGKRVSSISLLSGGEKAMTAVALVFAIFRLNPAPFCLLDEVDAPLDEANVGRLAAMVKEMSQSVQFLFVTHNKATMEAAEQLSGVTMREPGVSRLVSVDLAEATRMVGTS